MTTVTKNQVFGKSKYQLIHAHFFFVDIIGLSDPIMSTKSQIKKIEILKKCISHCPSFKNSPKENLLIDQHGDGMCIGFLQGPDLPLQLAIELHERLGRVNKSQIAADIVNVRIGLNSGICYTLDDLNGVKTTWGPGVVLAKRVMDFGDEDHILLTPELAENLREISDDYKKIIKPVHDFKIKHGKNILVYSVYGKGFGNKIHPTRGDAQISKFVDELEKFQKTVLYPSVEAEISLIDPKRMLVQHKRTYEIKNISDEPIKDVLHGIATDVDVHSLDDLNVEVYDENNEVMKISSISVDRPTTKEFTTRFNQPVEKGQSGRKFTLIYEVEEPERYFENEFQVDVGHFELDFKYPSNLTIKPPKIYEINHETEEKHLVAEQPEVKKIGNYNVLKFSKEQNHRGEILKIEW